MDFNFLESGIKLFDDTFNTIKNLFSAVVSNNTPNYLKDAYVGRTSNGHLYIRWVLPDDTYYRLDIEPNIPRIRLLYYDGTNTSTICTFTVS